MCLKCNTLTFHSFIYNMMVYCSCFYTPDRKKSQQHLRAHWILEHFNIIKITSFWKQYILFFFAGDILHWKVFVRLQLDCKKTIEFPYYASQISRNDICCYCCVHDTTKDRQLSTKFRICCLFASRLWGFQKESHQVNTLNNRIFVKYV